MARLTSSVVYSYGHARESLHPHALRLGSNSSANSALTVISSVSCGLRVAEAVRQSLRLHLPCRLMLTRRN